jgi:hypothetical protein
MRFDKWENSLGVATMEIDTLGRINQPQKPIMSGQMGSLGTITGAQNVPFDEFWVEQGISYNSSTRRFTVSKTGIYRVSLNAFQLSGQGGTRLYIGVNTDTPSSSGHRGHSYGSDANHQILHLESVFPLNANDFIVFRLAAGGIYNATGDRFNQFTIEMIA